MFGYSAGTAVADMPACYSITGALGIPAITNPVMRIMHAYRRHLRLGLLL